MTFNRSLRFMLWAVAALLIVAAWHQPTHASTAESKFYAAQRCYADLQKNEQRQKYRDQWLRCITQFMAVYRHDPHGPWAAAGLYNAGVLYGELYKRSFVNADRQEALTLFDSVERNFPQSRYRPRAQAAAEQMRGGRTAQAAPAAPAPRTAQPPTPSVRPSQPAAAPAAKPAQPPPVARPATAAAMPHHAAQKHYEQAQSNDRRLEQRPELQKFRDQWLKSITSYRQAFQAEPNGVLAPAALYGLADSYAGLYRWSRNEVDLIQAQKTFQELIDKFPQSTHADQARAALGIGPHAPMAEGDADAIAQVIQASRAQVPAVREPAGPQQTSDQPAIVEGLRFWSNPRYTRVVIDASQDAVFTYRELREDPAIGMPQRIYIDLHNSRLSKDLQRVFPINDDLLSDARAGQYTKDTVRVVVDIKSAKTFKIFSLKTPFRIVLDVWGTDTEAGTVASQPRDVDRAASQRMPPSAIVKQLALGVRRIVIDPGHGGRDSGAPGYVKGVYEKDIVLAISKVLAAKIRTQLKCEVILTRETDVYLSLEERTAIANTQNADLFISVHTNAAPNRRASGFETYILNLATDDESIRVAARENATSMKNISDLDSILKDLMQNAKVSESTRLASYVQMGALNRLGRYNVLDKGVKKAPFYVLLGAEMPSILVETGFISNPEECKRLMTAEYQEMVAQGIVDGIKRYIEEMHPTTFTESVSGRGAGG
jgi:N-acetylmuramoyl-L-alanine amidase